MHDDPIPFITLPSWIRAGANCGFNIEPVLREHGIETDLLHQESARVSVSVLQQVMEACVARARHEHFPFALGEAFSFEYLPDLETYVTTSPTLRDAIRVLEWVRELINSVLGIELLEDGRYASLVLTLRGDDRPPFKPYFIEAIFASIVRFARLLLGAQARFERLSFRHEAPPYAVEGRKETVPLLSALRGQFRGTLGYAWFTGGGQYNLRRDRDYATVALRYEF